MVETQIMRISPWVLFLCASATGGFGCSAGAKSEKAIKADDLPESGEAADGAGWETASFPNADDCAEDGSRWLKLDRKSKSEGLLIAHELGRVPSLILSYTSPNASGCGSTLGAGDSVIIDYADEEKVKIHNNTNSAVYVRLVLL